MPAIFQPRIAKKINYAPSVRVILICCDHKLLWRDSCKCVDHALTLDESTLHKVIIIIILWGREVTKILTLKVSQQMELVSKSSSYTNESLIIWWRTSWSLWVQSMTWQISFAFSHTLNTTTTIILIYKVPFKSYSLKAHFFCWSGFFWNFSVVFTSDRSGTIVAGIEFWLETRWPPWLFQWKTQPLRIEKSVIIYVSFTYSHKCRLSMIAHLHGSNGVAKTKKICRS